MYNGGLTGMTFGQITVPLPLPEHGKKWAIRWHDTPKGEIIPVLVQVNTDEELNGWSDGYPKC